MADAAFVTTNEVVVVTGGGPLHPSGLATVGPDAWVVAADSGADHARDAGLRVSELVGDLDSVEAATVAALENAGAQVDRHPRDKDETDLELALAAARARSPERIVVLGGDGGRLDHLIANVAVLGPVATEGQRIEAWFGPAHVQLAVPGRAVEVPGPAGSLVSLLALHGTVSRVRTSGLRWQLDGEELPPGLARGVSNELLDSPARVEVAAGVLTVIQPDVPPSQLHEPEGRPQPGLGRGGGAPR